MDTPTNPNQPLSTFTDDDLKRLKLLHNIGTSQTLGEALANWECVCGRHASIEHPFGGYCKPKEIIEKLLARLEAAERLIEFSSGPANDAWLEAERDWLQSAGKK